MTRFEDEVDRTMFDLDNYLDSRYNEPHDEADLEDETIEGLDLEDYTDDE